MARDRGQGTCAAARGRAGRGRVLRAAAALAKSRGKRIVHGGIRASRGSLVEEFVMSMFRTSLSRLALAFAPLLIAGCAATTVPLAPAAPDLFDDAHFAPASQTIDPAEVFRLTPEMLAYVKDVIEP